MDDIIRKIEKKYEFIVNAYGELMTLINRDYIYELVNDSWCRSFGRKREYFIGKTVADIWGQERFEQELKSKMDQCFCGNVFKEEDDFVLTGGKRRYYEVTYYPYTNEKKEVSHIIVVTNDISERKLAELALKKSEEELKISNRKKDNYLAIINSDLDKASEYVKSLLPPTINNENFKINWKIVSSSKLGGDTFGYHRIDDNNLAIYILDVTGHGVGAALHSVAALNTLKYQTLTKTDFKNPEQVLNSLNNAFQMSEHNSLFITMWYCVFNLNTYELFYAGAAHPPLIIMKPKGEITTVDSANMMIGLDQNINFTSGSIKIDIDSVLYLYTDGAYEIELQNGETMKVDDLIKFLCDAKDENSDEIEGLYKHLVKLNNNNKLDDDFTILKINFK